MFFERAAYLYETHGIFVSHSTELLENGGLPLLAEFQSRLTTNLQGLRIRVRRLTIVLAIATWKW
jgi:hypothetical protein